MHGIDAYSDIIGEKAATRILQKAQPLQGKSLLHVNATYLGGGVAEMLISLVPLLDSLGIKTDWRIIRGTPEFFEITKSFHNGLQSEAIELNDFVKDTYTTINKEYSFMNHIHHDLVIIHDPQPLALIDYYVKKQPWVWRCHIDLSNPNQELWDFLLPYIKKYDKVIMTGDIYKQKDLKADYKFMHPSIDPLAKKNNSISSDDSDFVMSHYTIPRDKPLIVQVSRYDKWKDPSGAIEVFKKVKEKTDCRLVLAGNLASDDPEGTRIYEDLRQSNKDLIEKGDVIMVLVSEHNDLFINALQREAAVVIQKSIKEGFGLVVTEAMWKGTPVVASNVGGIPYQIEDGVHGYLCDPQDHDGFARRITELIEDNDLARQIGTAAKERVREKFLITRLAEDYLDLMHERISDAPLARIPQRDESKPLE